MALLAIANVVNPNGKLRALPRPTHFLPISVIYLAAKVTGCLWMGHRQWQMQTPYLPMQGHEPNA